MQAYLPACSASGCLFNTILWLHSSDAAFTLAVKWCGASTVHDLLACTQCSLLAHASSNHFARYIEYNAHQGILFSFRRSKLSYGL